MKCLRCQAENRQGRRFCAECGTPLASSCPACGFSNEPAEKFCGGCGASLTPAPATGKFGSPESYTPKHLAEKILTSRDSLEGERKQVTVLFADLKGSMELLADRDPEEARKILDPVLTLMMDAVHRYEGTVNQVMGDGIMALFGAPLAHEDHAMRACYAALRMQETIKAYSEELRKGAGVSVAIRVGVNSGEVVVRSIGSDLHMDYTAVGQTTHLAARMEQAALPGSILVTAHTLRLAESYVQVKPLGPVNVKGLDQPVETYEVTGAGLVRTRLQASAARGLSRFVGRADEMQQLNRALEQARAGHGQLVAVVGEPGVGKSRLFHEFAHSHRTHGWRVLQSASVSYGKGTSYLPLIELVKSYVKIESRDDTRAVRAKITAALLALDRALEDAVSPLLAMLDALPPDDRFLQLDPPHRRQLTITAIKRLVLRESRVQPLLLVFEDLHWIDTETQAVLDCLVDGLPSAPILLAVNYRPEYRHAWGSKSCYRQLRIDPLPAASADELLSALMGDHPNLEPLKQLLIDRTEGNPFFLEESVRTLVETRSLVGEGRAFRLERPLTSIQVPASVQAILAARIDRLQPEDKQLLQSAAVVGKDVELGLLEAVAEFPPDQLAHGLARLHAAEFLYETRLYPDPEYTFKHALTHEVAYGSVLHDRRRALHARLVEAMEHRYRDRLTEHVERLAHHAMRGELWEKAAIYGQRACSVAADRSASGQAGACFDQALEALARLPESRETLEQAIELRRLRAAHHFALGEREGVLRCMKEAMALAERLGDQPRLAMIVAVWANALWFAGDNARALEAGSRAVALAETIGDHPAAAVSVPSWNGADRFAACSNAWRWPRIVFSGAVRRRQARTLPSLLKNQCASVFRALQRATGLTPRRRARGALPATKKHQSPPAKPPEFHDSNPRTRDERWRIAELCLHRCGGLPRIVRARTKNQMTGRARSGALRRGLSLIWLVQIPSGRNASTE